MRHFKLIIYRKNIIIEVGEGARNLAYLKKQLTLVSKSNLIVVAFCFAFFVLFFFLNVSYYFWF